ncbi:wound-induced protein 1-like [Phoenix dactylifera]|uniref:Wound-induced protein 1-like n=1 Tax=Phoenix dactylifera TaxID=42345 RepID=A0A8B9A0Z3_PHODC|nr:wound-induced protein 1-like [Phoenix dactylifera]XP_038980265.1 wound-induced protein 1-like [Phoenix dactylifera]
MMRLLTGASPEETFEFLPLSIEAFGSTVLVEGTDRARSSCWVHAWTVSADGIITQVREYFDTSVTVTRVGSGDSSSSTSNVPNPHCLPVWQSRLPDRGRKSLPGLVLAI